MHHKCTQFQKKNAEMSGVAAFRQINKFPSIGRFPIACAKLSCCSSGNCASQFHISNPRHQESRQPDQILYKILSYLCDCRNCSHPRRKYKNKSQLFPHKVGYFLPFADETAAKLLQFQLQSVFFPSYRRISPSLSKIKMAQSNLTVPFIIESF
ncbi:unknown [Ruminococcus sp. CAG:403]|nr:unknown [Ruminococcus sp. CAG:403]